MKNYNIVIYIILLFVGFGLYKQSEYTHNNMLYENQKLKQNDSISNVHIDSIQKFYSDSLQILMEINLNTEPDTIYIKSHSTDTVEVTLTDSNTIYNFSDVYKGSRFNLNIDATLLVNSMSNTGSFKYQIIKFPDLIRVYAVLSTVDKRIYAIAKVNGFVVESKGNIYSEVYDGIYDKIINKYRRENYKWYDRFGVGIMIGYNAYGKIIPSIGIGYNINLKEILE